jgi:hypothetical protein
MMRMFTLVIALLVLAGCATSIPQAENFPQSRQKKLMAAQHWNLVAQDAVKRTRQVLTEKGFAADTPLHILQNTDTVFDHAFKKYMIANFIEAGAVVSTKKEGALEISYDTQVIKHAAYFEPDRYGYQPGMATAGVGGFWVLRDVVKDLNFLNSLATIGIAGAYDIYQANNPGETGVELLLTTSITHRDRYVMLNADAYYIENAETWLFEPCKGRNRRYCQ